MSVKMGRAHLLEILYMVYEVEFPVECLEKEFEPMTDDELMERLLSVSQRPPKILCNRQEMTV